MYNIYIYIIIVYQHLDHIHSGTDPKDGPLRLGVSQRRHPAPALRSQLHCCGAHHPRHRLMGRHDFAMIQCGGSVLSCVVVCCGTGRLSSYALKDMVETDIDQLLRKSLLVGKHLNSSSYLAFKDCEWVV